MKNLISKSKCKPKILQYFREVEQTGKELIITDRGKPVLKIIPFKDPTKDILKELKGSVVEYVNPTMPVGAKDWDALK